MKDIRVKGMHATCRCAFPDVVPVFRSTRASQPWSSEATCICVLRAWHVTLHATAPSRWRRAQCPEEPESGPAWWAWSHARRMALDRGCGTRPGKRRPSGHEGTILRKSMPGPAGGKVKKGLMRGLCGTPKLMANHLVCGNSHVKDGKDVKERSRPQQSFRHGSWPREL